MPPESGRKWGTECLNTRFPLLTLQYAGYSVKLIFFYIGIFSNFFYILSQRNAKITGLTLRSMISSKEIPFCFDEDFVWATLNIFVTTLFMFQIRGKKLMHYNVFVTLEMLNKMEMKKCLLYLCYGW